MGFRLVSKSVTLNDLERRNGRVFCVISPNSLATCIYHVTPILVNPSSLLIFQTEYCSEFLRLQRIGTSPPPRPTYQNVKRLVMIQNLGLGLRSALGI